MRKSFALALSVSAILTGFNSAKAAVGENNEPPSIFVSGEGKAYAKPDLATVDIGVVSEASTAAQALSANSTAMASLMKTISDQGIEDRDVQTSNFSVSPTYANVSNRPKINGYAVRNSVHVRVRKTASLGQLLDGVVQSGANNIDSVGFTIDNPSRLLDEARKQAVEDARRKATLYAQAAGVQLGKVLYVIEAGAATPIRPMAMNMQSMRTQSVPVASGEQEMTVNTTVVFAIQ